MFFHSEHGLVWSHTRQQFSRLERGEGLGCVKWRDVSNIFDWVDRNDIKNLTEKFGTIVGKVIGDKNIEVLLDFENLTSLVLYEDAGIRAPKGENGELQDVSCI